MVGVASPPASSDFRTEPETVHLSTPYPQFMSLFQDLANKARNYAHNDSRNNDRKGVLLPLPTKSEVEAQCQFVEIYITSIPTSGASITVKYVIMLLVQGALLRILKKYRRDYKTESCCRSTASPAPT